MAEKSKTIISFELENDYIKFLSALAERDKVSVSQLLRDSVDTYIKVLSLQDED